jgi:hypothetical protein
MNVLIVGATGSIGRLVVEDAVRKGHTVCALVRDPRKARYLLPQVQVVAGDLIRPDTLGAAVDGVDAIVFTHGSDGGGKAETERVDYGGVRNVLAALGGRAVRIALMTAIGVTNREGDYNRRTEAHDWKRRGDVSCVSAACRTRSCDPAGSTTTRQTSIGSSCSKVITVMLAIPATGSSRAARSLRCWSPASRLMLRSGKHLNWSPNKARRSSTWTCCSLRSMRTPRAHLTPSTTSRTCRCRRNRSGCDTN